MKTFFHSPMSTLGVLIAFVAATLASADSTAQDGTWITTGGGNWTDSGNWSGGTIADGTGSTAFFTSELTATSTVTLNGTNRTIGGITFTDGVTSSDDLTLSSDILTLAGTSPTVNVAQSDRTLTISSIVAGSNGLTKTGAGTLALNSSAVNTFTGGVSVSGGTLSLDLSNLGTPTNLVDSGNALTLGSGSLALFGATTNTAQTFSGISLGAGRNTMAVTRGGSATATLNLGALTVGLGSANSIDEVWGDGVASTTELIRVSSYNGAAVGGSVIQTSLIYRSSASDGAARYARVNTAANNGQIIPRSGPYTTISTINLTNGTGGTVYTLGSSGGGDIQNSNTDAQAFAVALNTGGTRTWSIANSGRLTLNGLLQISGGHAIIAPGTGNSYLRIGPEKNLVIAMDNSGATTISAPIVDSGSTNINGAGGTASSVTIASTMPSGSPGTVTLSGTGNNYSGGTFVTGTTLRLGASEVIPHGAGKGGVTVDSTLDLRGFSETINGLSGAGTVDNGGAGTPTLTVGAGNASATFSGTIQNTVGTLSLEKIGTGIQTLAGVNAYDGTTTVSAGTLLVTGSLSTAGGVVVAPGATFSSTGTITGDMAFDVTSILNVENLSPSSLTPFDVSGGTVSFAAGTPGSRFGVDNLSGIDWETLSSGNYTLITGTVDGTNLDNLGESNATSVGFGKTAYFEIGSLQLVVVPEPSTLALVAIGCAGLGCYAARRRRGSSAAGGKEG